MQYYITKGDIALVKKLGSTHYENRGMIGVVPVLERSEFLNLRRRLKNFSDFFKNKYDYEYGKFLSENSTGNPVGKGGELRRVWSGIFKGTENKQYSAQISFVINGLNECLDVGLYFGRASTFGLEKHEREILENELQKIGALLSQTISQEIELRNRFYDLFEIGFRAEIRREVVTPEQWLANASQDPRYSSVVISLYPNAFGYIDVETIDFYVSMVLPLIGVIPESISSPAPEKKRKVKALTPEQRAKKAERLALIGLQGEKFIMELEKKKLSIYKISKKGYPIHKALDSDNEGFDILSYGPEGEDIFIEVKTTTMPKNHPYSKMFFLSASEYEFYQNNKRFYRLYRVWDIFGHPSYDEINLEKVELKYDGFKVVIKSNL